ncbi:hypothetical protein ACTOB_005402 [Actinoplanes oblitus]|uniref:Double-GTPase 2 domain-containing protein n=1 Tax=Actinoplanes oblitus TaxID=3040509 RepID=A0ABY8W939_9ACTN|nr:hypothetical protein [Actinoplanes oblitus]WIM93425.1 hypothetical protein ACTOB_005402 [Actinoplanes oblitus]
MRTPYCPYCYHELPAQSVMYRCSGRIGRGGQRCETAIDPLLAAYTGDTTPKFPAFSARGRRRGHPACPQCGEVSFQRICGRCHNELPALFGEADTRLIALVGAKESGKTVYMTVLLHELQNRVGEQFGLSVMGADDHTKDMFQEEYEKRLYDQGVLVEATAPARADLNRRPFVFGISLTQRKWGVERLDRSLFSFFDTAGEDLRTKESVERNVRYLTAADGIVLMLDPLQMRAARSLAEPGAQLPTEPRAPDNPANVLARITELLHGALRTGRRGLIGKPIAVVFSKLDALDGTLPEDSVLLRDSPDREPLFDEADSAAVDREVRGLLAHWHGSGMETVLARNYETFRFFGVTALGSSPVRDDKGTRVSGYGVQSRRVQDPFLWLLQQFGTISKKKAQER